MPACTLGTSRSDLSCTRVTTRAATGRTGNRALAQCKSKSRCIAARDSIPSLGGFASVAYFLAFTLARCPPRPFARVLFALLDVHALQRCQSACCAVVHCLCMALWCSAPAARLVPARRMASRCPVAFVRFRVPAVTSFSPVFVVRVSFYLCLACLRSCLLACACVPWLVALVPACRAWCPCRLFLSLSRSPALSLSHLSLSLSLSNRDLPVWAFGESWWAKRAAALAFCLGARAARVGAAFPCSAAPFPQSSRKDLSCCWRLLFVFLSPVD